MKQRQQEESRNMRDVSVMRRARPAKASGDELRIATHIRSFGFDVNQETRSHMRKIVDRRLGKFADSIERVSIRFEDVNGPRGGVDQTCRMKVVLKNLPGVVFENQNVSLIGAFNRALAGTERKVRRIVQRRRSKPMKKSPVAA